MSNLPRRPILRPFAGAVALATAGVLAIAGCSNSKTSSVVANPAVQSATTTAAAPTTGATVPATTAAVAGTAVTATEKEYSITLSQTNFTPGTYTFVIKNVGSYKHNLVVNGPGVAEQRSNLVPPGDTGTMTVTLAAGSYEIWCGVPTHRAKGMDLHITVG